jgi:hypothetical protein
LFCVVDHLRTKIIRPCLCGLAADGYHLAGG